MEQTEIIRLLSSHGLRPTQQRIAVYAYLRSHRTHPSAETVYAALVKQHPTFSRTTVYKSLHALVKAQLVLELSPGTEEKHYDGDVSLHGHFCCTGCGGIFDFPLDPAAVEALQPAGFTVQQRDIRFGGLCPACAQATANEKTVDPKN